MEMINWSLNAIDSIFSTRKRGSGEPVCPDGTSPAGYTLDSWNKWQPLCLSTLSIEDSEDVYIFGILVAGILLFGFGAILFYHKFGGMAVRKIHDLLADKIDGMYKELSRVVVESAVSGQRRVVLVEQLIKDLAARSLDGHKTLELRLNDIVCQA